MLLLGSWLWDIWKPQPKAKPVSEELPPNMASTPSSPAALPKNQADFPLGVAADAAAVPLRQ
jgi:hypothetical protein